VVGLHILAHLEHVDDQARDGGRGAVDGGVGDQDVNVGWLETCGSSSSSSSGNAAAAVSRHASQALRPLHSGVLCEAFGFAAAAELRL
jgi:hypothetical protein